MPAYNAARTLEQTFHDLPHDIVDTVILTDDASHDNTIDVARCLGLNVFVHESNNGYGANQKTCYQEALKKGADIIIMVHPDYQYTPKLVCALTSMIAYDVYDAAIASRIIGNDAIRGGMPFYKYVSNRFLTFIQNILIGHKLSEYHTGFRAFSKEILNSVPLKENSNDFIFDNQILVQTHYYGFRIGEISCPTKYFPEASSINFVRSIKYGMGVLWTSLLYRLVKFGLMKSRIFPK